MVVGPAVIGLLVDEVARGVVFRHVCGSWQLVQSLSWMRCFGHGDESASLGWSDGVCTSSATFATSISTQGGVEYVSCLTTCTDSDAHILFILWRV